MPPDTESSNHLSSELVHARSSHVKGYLETLEWLFSKHHSLGMRLGLSRMQEACRRLGNPEATLRCIHVAGTNGKGSVCTKIAKAFELSGLTTGLFTSPHISSFRERIQINGTCISEQEVVDDVASIRALCQDDLTFFEITTLLAFLWFQRQRVGISIFETGLGGRLDATNVCQPELCVITSISFDHMDYLGKTLEDIAREKAGILKKGIPVVIGPKVPFDVISHEALERKAPLHRVEGEWADFDDENSAIATKALSMLNVRQGAIEEAILSRPPCRFQEVPLSLIRSRYQDTPSAVILDVAHNPDGMHRLLMKAKSTFQGTRFCILLAVCCDKDVKEMVCKLSDEADTIVCTAAPSPRAMPASTLAGLIHRCQQTILVKESSDPQEALRIALQIASKKGLPLLITGTFYFMSAVRKALGFVEIEDCFDLNSTAQK